MRNRGIRQSRQLMGEEAGGFIGESECGRVGDFAQLTPEGGVERGMVVTVEIGPDAGVGIQKSASMNIRQHSSLPVGQDDRFLPEPVLHLGERMPHMGMIQLSESMHRK